MAQEAPIMVGTSPNGIYPVKAPTSISWGLQDVSASDSGRVNDGNATMYKNRVTQKRKLSLAWTDPTISDTSAILSAFNPEYVWVRYLDPMSGGYELREFYVGDRTSPFRQITVGGALMTSLSFDIIER